MSDHVKTESLDGLPLLLAGPILRQTTPDSIAVWMALKQPCHVELTVHDTTQNGAAIGDRLFAGNQTTVALGQGLHVVVVTAKAASGQALACDRLYAYDLQFTLTDQPQQPPQTLQQALCSDRFPAVTISYFEHQKPTFLLPPDRLQDLRLVQGSCRKAHGDGFDALPMLDCLLEAASNQPRQRPQQLFLTGDQIYGDDVADPLLWVATQLGDRLLGWEEQLPTGDRASSLAKSYTPKELPAGHRAEIATDEAGFTAGLRHKFAKVNSHLLGLGEYYASYLLAWSPVCWPDIIPDGNQIAHVGATSQREYRQTVRRWDQEARDIRQLIHTLWKVRRALANIATYTIFDDHDVSDDWNLNQAWCLRVLGRPLGRRAVQNALTAYATFQAWGNTPHQFEGERSGTKLLQAAQDWSASKGTNHAALAAIAQYVGMPSLDPHTDLPLFVRDDETLILDRHPEVLTWHYTVQGACHEVLVLDTRTWRGYPADQEPIAPPMLLCPQAFERQLSQPLRSSKANQQAQRITIVVAPTNLFGLQAIDWIHHWQLSRRKVYATDVGDAWNIHTEALANFLTVLFKEREQVIVLSGDIHYSSLVRLSYTPTSVTELSSVLVQLTCSALKNEEPLTKLIHTRLKDWLLPEKIRRWSGWSNPLEMVEQTAAQPRQKKPALKPDWFCVLEWMPRCRTQQPTFGNDLTWLVPSWKHKQPQWRWLQPFCFWRSRWFQDGREVVGLNNLALVQFESIDTGQSSSYKVIQDLHWFSPWSPTQIVYSRFESPLVPNQKLLKQSSRRLGLRHESL